MSRENISTQAIFDINKITVFQKKELIQEKQQKQIEEIEQDMQLIKQRKFAWTDDILKRLRSVFDILCKVEKLVAIKFANLDYFTENFPPIFFYNYINIGYGKIGGDNIYDLFTRTGSVMLLFFKNNYLQKDLCFLPRIHTETCYLLDPAYRQKIRNFNQNQKFIKDKYFNTAPNEFNIVDLLNRCVELFFPNSSWRWIGGSMYAHRETLEIILLLFEYGLWENKYINIMLTQIYSISEVMYTLENFIYRDCADKRVGNNFAKDQQVFCAQVRTLIAKIFTHLIIYFLDQDVLETLKFTNLKIQGNDLKINDFVQPKFNIKKIMQLFQESFFSKKKLYTYFSYVLITYIARYNKTNTSNDYIITSDDMNKQLSMLFNFVSDINGDFFRNSIKSLKEENFPFYFLKDNNSLEPLVQDIKTEGINIIECFRKDIQQDTDLQGMMLKIFDISKKWFKSIENYMQNEDNYKTQTLYNCYNLKINLLTLYQIPNIIVSILDLIPASETFQGDTLLKRTEVFCEGLVILRRLCLHNSWAQDQIFSLINLQHFKSIYDENTLQINYLFMDIIKQSKSILLIEENEFLFEIIIKKYDSLLLQFGYKIDYLLNNNKENNFQPEKLLDIYAFNKVFCCMLEVFSNKRSKYELVLSQKCSTIAQKILQCYSRNLIPIQKDANFIKENFQNQINFQESIQQWKEQNLNENQQNIIINIVFTSFLDLLARSSSKFFTEQVYCKIKETFEQQTLQDFQYLLDTSGSFNIFSRILRLYTIFNIFPNNNLLNKRQNHFFNLENEGREILIQDKLMKQNTISDVLKIGKQSIQILQNQEDSNKQYGFFYCYYFPLVFKIYSGILNLFIYEEHKTQYKSFEYISDLTIQFQEIIQQLTIIQENKNLLKDNNKTQKQKYKNITFTIDFLQEYSNKIKQDYMCLYDEPKGTKLFEIRKKGYELLDSLIQVYQYAQFKSKHIEQYVRYDDKNTKKMIFKTMQKTLHFNSLFREKNQKKFIRTIDYSKFDFSNPYVVKKFLSNYYKVTKTHFHENPEQNQCFTVLKSTDILRNNIEFYINYFLNEIVQMDIDYTTDLKQNIFYNQSYVSMLVMIDNLLQNSDKYRDTFYQILIKKIDATAQIQEQPIEAFKKIWKIHKDLFNICLFKPFLDKNWSNVYTLYYLISNFLQNLCEGNHVQFKLWFQNQPIIRENNDLSMFNYYFQMLEIAYSQTRVFKNKTDQLILSDKPEIFFLLNRITEGFTEFINGSNITTQKLIYKYKINVWVGIILRPINDLDSLFYELKWHVLNYILGLTEGFDIEILRFLAANFPIIKLYQHLIYLVKILFVRQTYFKQYGYQKNILLTQKQIDECTIESDNQILDYYKKYDNTFSNHIVLNVVVSIYQLMRDISSKVIRYENFLLEKNLNVLNLHKLNDKEKENAYIWKFIQQIIVDIEIYHKEDDDNTNNEIINCQKTKANFIENDKNLRIFYFKKLPVCFFLTDSMKRRFFDVVKIDSLEEKHEQFFDSVQKFQIQVEDQQKLFKKSKLLFKLSTESNFYLYKLILYCLCVVINIFILLFYNNERGSLNNYKGNAGHLINILSIISISFSLFILLFWFVVKYNTIKKIKWVDYELTNGKNQKPNIIDIFKINFIDSIFKQADFQSFFFQFFFSVCGLTFSQSMYTFSLLLIIHLNMLVYNVAMSFLQNLNKLFFTFIIILVVINSFSFIIAQNYRNKFKPDDLGKDSTILCDTYFRCFMNTINLGLRGGGGISDYMFLQATFENSGFISRFVFDILFFIFVNLILLGIFFGIIVDSFADYRDNMTKRNNDEQNVCFTCGLDKPNLEKIGINFNKHREFHDIWNYFYYIMYLKWKPSNYYDGVDIYVNQMIEENYRDDWLPLKNTHVFEFKGQLQIFLNYQIKYFFITQQIKQNIKMFLVKNKIVKIQQDQINKQQCKEIIYKSISIYIELLQMLLVCKQFKLIVSRAVLLKMMEQKIDIDNFKEMGPKQLIQTFQFHFSKFLIMCPSIEKFFDLEDSQNVVKKICLPQKIPIKNIQMTKNYLILIAQNKNILLSHKSQFSQGFKILRKDFTFNNMIELQSVQKYEVAHNFYYLDLFQRLFVRVFNKNSIQDELTLQIIPDLKVFGEREVKIIDFVVNEYQLVFKTSSNNYYFMKGAERNVLNPIQLLSNQWHIFKIKVHEDIRQISMSQNHFFILHQNGSLSYKNLQKLKFEELLEKYTNNKIPEHITLIPEKFKSLKNQKIFKIYNRKNFFLFQEKEERKKIQDFDFQELNEFISQIFKRKFMKIVQHYRITGQQILDMDDDNLQKQFGMHNIEISKLKDHILIHQNIMHSRPKFYAFGFNPQKQFGLSQHLNYLVEINLPNFDNNEEIVDVKISEKFTIIQTNKDRSFISLKMQEEERNRKISITGVKEQQNKKKKKKQQKQQKKKGNRKGSNVVVEEQEKKVYKNGWLDVIDLIKTKNKEVNIDKNIHFWNIEFVGNQFFMFYSKNINEQCVQYFSTAKEFLQFIKLNKNFDQENILFFSHRDKFYHPYKTVIASEQKLKDTTVIKLKKENKILWRMSNRYFDVKSFVNQESY